MGGEARERGRKPSQGELNIKGLSLVILVRTSDIVYDWWGGGGGCEIEGRAEAVVVE